MAAGLLVCSCCGDTKSLSDFARRRRCPQQAVCKSCVLLWGGNQHQAVRLRASVRFAFYHLQRFAADRELVRKFSPAEVPSSDDCFDVEEVFADYGDMEY